MKTDLPEPTILPCPDTPQTPSADSPTPARKHRSDAKLLNLPTDQREQLVDWLLDGMSYKEAQKQVASDFGIEIRSLNRFSEFWDAFCVPRILEQRAQRLTNTRACAAAALEDARCFDLATFDAVRQRAYLLACSPASSIDDITRALDLVLRIRKLEYAERKLALAEKQRSTQQPSATPETTGKSGARPAETAQSSAGSSAAASAALEEAYALLNGSRAKGAGALARHFTNKPITFSAVPPSATL